jgi:PAS domain S-box-containing protein
MFRDQTLRIRAEEALREHSAEQATLLDSLPIQLWYLLDPETYGMVNQAHADFLGRTKDGLAQRKLADCLSPEDRRVYGSKQVFNDPRKVYREQWVYDGSGFRRLLAITQVPQFAVDQKIDHVVCFGQDITEFRNIEQELKRSEREKRLILESTTELIVLQDKRHRIIWANRAAGDSVGQRVEDLVGRHCFEIWMGKASPCQDCPVKEALHGRRAEQEIQTPDGRFWRVNTDPVYDQKDSLIGVVETALDITDKKLAEIQLKQEKDGSSTQAVEFPAATT